MRLIVAWCAVLLGSTLLASEAVDRECLRYNDAVAKLQKTRDEALTKEKAKVIAGLTAVAKREAKVSNLAGAGEAWKAVLSIDDTQADARKYFEALGQLDAVLAEMKQAASTDLLGAPIAGKAGKEDAEGTATPKAPAIAGKLTAIAAAPSKASGLGPFKKGTTITLQYVSGTWRLRGSGMGRHSPDDAAAPPKMHLRVASDVVGTDAVLAVVPTDTAHAPYSIRLETDCPAVYLYMNTDDQLDLREGEVEYRVEVVAR